MPDLRESIIQKFAERATVPGNSQSATAFACLAALSNSVPIPKDPPMEYRTVVAALTTIAFLGMPCVAACARTAALDPEVVNLLASMVAMPLGATADATLELIEQLADKVPA